MLMVAKRKKPNPSSLVKKSWVDRAIETARYHADKCKITPHWTISDTATLLHRSYGSVNEDLQVVSWMKTHSDQIRKFKYIKDALAFIREKRKSMNLDVSHVD